MGEGKRGGPSSQKRKARTYHVAVRFEWGIAFPWVRKPRSFHEALHILMGNGRVKDRKYIWEGRGVGSRIRKKRRKSGELEENRVIPSGSIMIAVRLAYQVK